MSLFRMDKPDETVRFLDPIDITLSLDSRQQQAHQKTDIELNVQPIIFRSSYRDIMLITEIVNKAIALASRSTAEPVVQSESAVADGSTLHPTTAASKRRRSSRVSVSSPTRTRARRSTVSRAPETKKPLVVLRKEHVSLRTFLSSRSELTLFFFSHS
jgi:vacuolar protein sorting-associated protein 13A/C